MDRLRIATFNAAVNCAVSHGPGSQVKWNKVSNKWLRYSMKALLAVPSFPIALSQDSYCLRSVTKSLFTKRIVGWFPYFEIVVTTRCSLRCKYCANLHQYYDEPYDVDLNTLKTSIDRLMKCCDYVSRVGLIGGEPFMYKNLPEVLEILMSYPQIGEIIIPTNGMISIHDQHLLELLRKRQVLLKVSDYGFGHADEFCRVAQENGIPYSYSKDGDWLDYGDLRCRNRSPEELKRQLKACTPRCVSLLNGKLYHCPRSGHGTDLGAVPSKSNEWLDFTDEHNTVSLEQLLEFYYYDSCSRDTVITACNYCDMGANGRLRHVPAGREQLSTPARD